jgi:hypothetical protein
MALPTRWNPFRPNNRFDLFPEFEDLVRNLGSRGPLARQHENTLDLLRCAACGQAPYDELGATQLPCQPPAEQLSANPITVVAANLL